MHDSPRLHLMRFTVIVDEELILEQSGGSMRVETWIFM